jgi:hypothetical protein
MKRATLAAVCFSALLVAGCGAGTDSRQETPVAAPQAEQSAGGLKTYKLAEAGFSIGIPKDWVVMTADEAYGAAVEQAIDENPELAQYREVLTGPDSPFKLVAIGPQLTAEMSSTINVISAPRKEHWDMDEFERGSIEGAREQATPGSSPTVERVKLQAGRALRIRFETVAPGTAVAATQYFVQTSSSIYILSYNTTPQLADEYANLFDRSARSLREL